MAIEEMDIEDLPGDCSDPNVLNKYISGGTITQQALQAVIQLVNSGERSVCKLCAHGDATINNLLQKGNKKTEKGIAFPTCISRNEIAGHFCPIEDVKKDYLNNGDLIKIDLGVHVDGFASLAATTLQVGGGEIVGRKADVLACAWTAAECAIRMMRPGTSNEDITDMLGKVGEAYGCECLEGVLSHELKQYVIDGENTILGKPKPEQQVEKFELEPNKVYSMDLVYSTGTGKAIRKGDHETTVFKRVIETVYNLKNKTSRIFLALVDKSYPAYPFSLREFKNNEEIKFVRAKMGLKECVAHDLVSDYPVLHEKAGEFIAQFKFTVVVRPNLGPLRLCGTESVDTSLVKTEKVVQNENIIKLLKTTWKKKKKKKKKKNSKPKNMDVE